MGGPLEAPALESASCRAVWVHPEAAQSEGRVRQRGRGRVTGMSGDEVGQEFLPGLRKLTFFHH